MNQLTSPPAEKARPFPVTTSARNGARSASQAAATVSSKISSGLIAFMSSGRFSVSVPTSPSEVIVQRLQLGGLRRDRARGRRSLPLDEWRRSPRPRANRDSPRSAGSSPTLPASTCSGTGAGTSSTWGRRTRSASGSGRTSRASRTARWCARIHDIEVLVTQTEAEALIAEQSFIKRYRPKFNIRLRDDKSYPYIAISLDEEFPRVYFTRERHKPNRAYFGPFSSAKRVRETLDLLGKLFQYRTCEGPEPGRRSGVPCLDHFIKRCQAPCVGYIDREEYRRNIDQIVGFLSGRYKQVTSELVAKMDEASAAQDFERAALFRDRLNAVQSLMERQRVAGGSLGSADLIGVVVEGTDANAQVFQVRDGVLAERQGFYLAGGEERDAGEVAESFLLQYYGAAPAVPARVVVGPELKDRTKVLEEALSTQRDSKVEVRVAARGDSRRLRELAERNAQLALAQDRLRREHRHQQRAEALGALQTELELERLPVRIEAFDISNLGETHQVASMVVFEGGAPKKSDYRKFKIRGDFRNAGRDDAGGNGGGPDDFAAMREVLTRRMARYIEQADLSPHDSNRDQSFAALPDLILIDGGKGQLGAGMKALQPLRRPRRHRDQPREANRGDLRPRPGGPRHARQGLRRAAPAAARARRGPPIRDHLPPHAAATSR